MPGQGKVMLGEPDGGEGGDMPQSAQTLKLPYIYRYRV